MCFSVCAFVWIAGQMAQYTASVFWLWLLPDSEKYFENYKNSIIPDVGHAELCVFAWIVFYYFTICHLFNLLNPWPCLCIQEGSCQLKLVIFTCFLSPPHLYKAWNRSKSFKRCQWQSFIIMTIQISTLQHWETDFFQVHCFSKWPLFDLTVSIIQL